MYGELLVGSGTGRSTVWRYVWSGGEAVVGRCFEDGPEDYEWEPMEHGNLCEFICGEGDDVGGSLLDHLYGRQDATSEGKEGEDPGRVQRECT